MRRWTASPVMHDVAISRVLRRKMGTEGTRIMPILPLGLCLSTPRGADATELLQPA